MSYIQAIEQGNLSKVQELIASGVDVNKVDARTYETPLQKASDGGHVEIVRMLLNAGASLRSDNKAPIEATTWNGHQEVVQLLTQFHPYTEDNHNAYAEAMLFAVILGRVEIVGILLDAGIAINAIIAKTGTALHYAAERQQVEVARFLITIGADINCPNTSEEAYDERLSTPLIAALWELRNPMKSSSALETVFRNYSGLKKGVVF